MDDQQLAEETTSDVTMGELYDAVTNGFDSESSAISDGFNMVGLKLDSFLAQSSDNESSSQNGSVVLDQEQIDTLTNGIKVLTTEGFFLIVALSILCGISCWRVFSRGWFK